MPEAGRQGPWLRAPWPGLWLALALLLPGCRQDMHNQPKYIPLRPSAFYPDGRSARPLVPGTVPRGFLREDAALYAGRTAPAAWDEPSPVEAAPWLPPALAAQSLDEPAAVPPEQAAAVRSGESLNVQVAAQRAVMAAERAAGDRYVEREYVDTFPFPITAATMRRGQERFDIFCSPCHGRLGDGEGMIVRRGLRHPPSFHDDRLRAAPVGHFFDVISHGFGAMQDYAMQLSPQDRWAVVAYVRALQLSQHATVADLRQIGRQAP